MFLATVADGQTAASWGKSKEKLQTLTLSPLFGGSSLGGPLGAHFNVENAPTCCRALKWPDPEFPRKIPKKIPPGPKFWNSKKIPQKYRKNTKNAHFGYFGGIFPAFSGYFGGKFWESRISGRGVFFRIFFVEIPGRATSGLCSRSGRS